METSGRENCANTSFNKWTDTKTSHWGTSYTATQQTQTANKCTFTNKSHY